MESVSEDVVIFHAGTKIENGKLVSSGGRVLNVTGISNIGLKEAINIAYHSAANINFENKYSRTDIGLKGL